MNRRDQLFLQESHRAAIILELRREAVDREVLGAQAMWRAREARAVRRAREEEGVATAAGQGSIRKPRAPKIFPLDWVPAQWRGYAKQQLAAAALRSRLKKPTLGHNQKPARQQSIGEVMAVRDRAKGIAARPITFDSFTDARGAKRPARESKMLQNLLKRPKNGVG